MQRIGDLWRSRWFQRWLIPALIFLLAFLPRAVYPVSRPTVWSDRAVRFSDAVLVRNWAGTFHSYHPGVTTMWLSAIGMRLLAWQRGLSSDQLLGVEPTKPGTMDDVVVAGVVPLALVIALCIALSYVLLRRITDQRVALVSSCLLALDPFYITYSKVLHVDALLTTFMFLSVLYLLNYMRRARWLEVVLGGAFAGLAFLTKSPSFFLIPYATLVVGLNKLAASGPSSRASAKGGEWVRQLWERVRILLTWGGVSAVVFVVLWPAMWVKPLDTVRRVVDGALFHIETVHENPVFFNGRAAYADPGWLFYPATIAWKTTLITLPMVCAALALVLLRFRRGKYSRMVWLLTTYVACFTLVMGLGDWKQTAYIAPVFPALDVIAAFGLVWSAEAIGRVRWWQKWHGVPAVLIALALMLQASIVLPRHPYYGTHNNTLLGGARIAQHILPMQDQGEGLDLAAQYLNTLPRAQRASAVLHQRSGIVFRRTFEGRTYYSWVPWANYRVYYVNQVMRHLGGEEWDAAWEADRQANPLWSVAFDGVTYVWVYGAPPAPPAEGGPEYEVDYQLGEHIQLKRVRLSSRTLAPGDTLTVVPIWESDGEVKRNYTVFCHLLSIGGDGVAQRDDPPVHGFRPTTTWRAGEIIEDSYDILLGTDLPPGEYELSVGMYDVTTMERLPAYNASGERLPEDRIVVGLLVVGTPETTSN
jgi:hypothetical protein